METGNPYSSPQSNLFGGSTAMSGDTVSQGVMLHLKKTGPWVRFMSVIMFLGAAFMLLAALMMGVVGGAGMMQQGPSVFGGKLSGTAFSMAVAAIYGLMAVLYIYPALKLWKYADRIRDLCNSMQVVDLEKALNEQRAFWKFVGVMVIALIVLYFVIIVVAVGAGIGAATKMAH
ncbi:MAG: hypothetical protein K1X78_19275 [Verrucomicrobiaceae bacterium]|nr:hypothetical protein [Verrucomicrobiaceae bacterium]